MTIQYLVLRNRGSRLMPDGKNCSEPGCGQSGQLQGPTNSRRLGEPVWVLRCGHGHSTHWWKRKGKLEPLSNEALEKLHSRGTAPIPVPRCPLEGCNRKMNPQYKPHRLAGGGKITFMHCQCRIHPSQRVYLVLPRGEVATRDRWAEYRWTDKLTGCALNTVSGIRPPQRKKRGGRPKGMTKERQEEARELERHIREFENERSTKRGAMLYACRKVYGGTVPSHKALARGQKTLMEYRGENKKETSA